MQADLMLAVSWYAGNRKLTDTLGGVWNIGKLKAHPHGDTFPPTLPTPINPNLLSTTPYEIMEANYIQSTTERKNMNGLTQHWNTHVTILTCLARCAQWNCCYGISNCFLSGVEGFQVYSCNPNKKPMIVEVIVPSMDPATIILPSDHVVKLYSYQLYLWLDLGCS